MKPKVSKYVEGLLDKYNQGIKLDIGCGANKNPNFVGMDILDLPGVDIVHNFEKFPWPLPDNSCCMAVASHVLEHISPTPHDPRTAGLVSLLLKKKLIKQAEVDEAIGEVEPGAIFLRFMNEVWRVLKPGAEFAIAVPYCRSDGMMWDPTHCNFLHENTWEYFDPEGPKTKGLFYKFYQPAPWKIKVNFWQLTGNMEVVLVKRKDEAKFHPDKKIHYQ